MKKRTTVAATSAVLILLWTYAAASKFIDYDQSRREMLNQIFPRSVSEVLAWAVPSIELVVATLLLLPKTLKTGLYASVILLVIFTGYIGLIMVNTFGRIPCSCGGILEEMTWGQHLAFNLVLLLLTSTALALSKPS